MMCEVLCKQFLREVAYRSSCLRRKCLFHAFHIASKSLGCRATYTQLRYLANAAVTPKVTATEIKHFIQDKEFKFQEGYACLHLPCPICAIGKSGKLDATMYVNKITGTFICYSCKHSGNWHLFQKYVSALRANDEKRLKFSKSEKGIFLTEEEEQKLQEILNSSCNISDLTKEEILKTSEEFCIEDFNSSCLKSFDIRISADRHCLLLPIRDFDCKLAGLYMLSLEKNSCNLHNYSIFPRKEIAALFGRYNSLNCKEVVLTSNPLDAMAVSQQTGIPGICVPQSTSLSEEVLPLMENFKKIMIWYGNNTKEAAAVTNIAKMMGESRCHLVYSQKDHVTPLTCLQENQSVANILKKAQPFIHRSIIKPHSIREKVLARICNKEETLGVKVWIPAVFHISMKTMDSLPSIESSAERTSSW